MSLVRVAEAGSDTEAVSNRSSRDSCMGLTAIWKVLRLKRARPVDLNRCRTARQSLVLAVLVGIERSRGGGGGAVVQAADGLCTDIALQMKLDASLADFSGRQGMRSLRCRHQTLEFAQIRDVTPKRS